jgi:arginase
VEEQEMFLLKKHSIHNFTVDDVDLKGPEKIVSESIALLKECDMIYVSFDVDSMDPHLTSHGTGTPVDKGLKPHQAEELLVGFAKCEKLVCLEVVEINPCLDERTNRMAEITVDILDSVVAALENK